MVGFRGVELRAIDGNASDVGLFLVERHDGGDDGC